MVTPDVFAPVLEGLDRAALLEPVRQALGDATADIDAWEARRMAYVELAHESGGLFRVHGTATTAGAPTVTRPWSLVLKVARAPAAGVVHLGRPLPSGWGRDPTHRLYWRREALTYQSGLLDDLGGGLTAAGCYGVQERSADSAWLWLEDVSGTQGVAWSVERYALAARHLGQFNGAYLVGRPLPNFPWLSRDWVRQWCQQRATTFDPALLLDPQSWAHPLVRRAFPQPIGEEVVRLWTEREQWLAALKRLPQTLCHLDAFSANLLARRDADGVDRTVAIDWACAGVAAMGADAGQLVIGSAFRGDTPTIPIESLWDAVLAGYQSGLTDAAWRGDDRLLAFCATAGVIVIMGIFVPSLALGIALNEHRHTIAAQRFRRPIEDLLRDCATVTYFLLERASAARPMLRELT
jgi:hypothetical protein